MAISYAITVCNELQEIKRLLNLLIDNKGIEDEVVILYDDKNGSQEVIDYLLPYNVRPGIQTWRNFFQHDFSSAKNKLNEYCKNPWIFQLDADEYIDPFLIQNINEILKHNEASNIDLIRVPRINTVEGITEDHIRKWGWNVNERGWINFPDYQTRLYRNHPNIKWHGKVHEVIVGAINQSVFPNDEEYCIKHPKTIARQEKQNNYYNTL
jgi:glycosyltransferase involved in cell wall biosynthesis